MFYDTCAMKLKNTASKDIKTLSSAAAIEATTNFR